MKAIKFEIDFCPGMTFEWINQMKKRLDEYFAENPDRYPDMGAGKLTIRQIIDAEYQSRKKGKK